MSEESARKRPRLSEENSENISKPELLEHIKKQELYIAELESKLETPGPSSAGDGEEKARHLKAARREQLLVMRLTTKEQELHELANQLADKTQNASTAQLRSAMVDPALNLLVQRLKRELEDKNTMLKQAHEDMAAWKFTADSQTGKRLMARCRTLILENQDLGKQVSQGKVAQVEAELALQRELNEEMKSSQDEMYEMVVQLNDEGEGMQSTILALQQELREKQQEISRLKNNGEASVASHIPAAVGRELGNDMDVKLDVENDDDMESAEPCEESMELGEDAEQEREETNVPAVRTTEYNDDTATSSVTEEGDAGDASAEAVVKDTLSVDPWTNTLRFVESPASPVEEVDDERTSDGEGQAETQFSSEPAREQPAVEERRFGRSSVDGSSERTLESTWEETTADAVSLGENDGDVGEEQEDRDSGIREVEHRFGTPPDESSQDSAVSGDVRDVETDDSSRTGQRSGNLASDFSTNGESRHESVTEIAMNNGEAEPLCVNSEYGREGAQVECSDETVSSTLVQDPSTYETVVGESNSLDNGSDVTDRQSDDTTTDNNNGMSNPGECVNSSVSSPLEDEVPPLAAGDNARTDSIVKPCNANSHNTSPLVEEGLAQCGDGDGIVQNSVPSTNSNPEEISV